MPKFARPNSYTGSKGTVTHTGDTRFANATEAIDATNDELAISPATLAGAIGTLVPDASTTVKGKVELATSAETVTGSDSVRAVVPSGLTARLAAPGAIGGITPGAGSFTTLSATSTIVAGTTLTATLGAITATNGNFVGSTAGSGLLLNSPTATGVAASPVIVNGRSGRAIFTSVSIAAAADLTLTLTNSAITGAATNVIVSMAGATTGSALSIKSRTASAGSLAIVVTNGTGATTTTADIEIEFLVIN